MAFDFLNQMLSYEPCTEMEDGQTCSDRLILGIRTEVGPGHMVMVKFLFMSEQITEINDQIST